MGRLAVNIYHRGAFYGPGFGNADQVPAEVAAAHSDPDLWVDGAAPAIHGNVAPIPEDAETVLEELAIEDRFPGVPTYEEARARHDATVDVTGLTVPELRDLHDEHGIGWVHRDPKPVLIARLQQAGVAR